MEYDIIEKVSSRKLLFIFPINDLDGKSNSFNVKHKNYCFWKHDLICTLTKILPFKLFENKTHYN